MQDCLECQSYQNVSRGNILVRSPAPGSSPGSWVSGDRHRGVSRIGKESLLEKSGHELPGRRPVLTQIRKNDRIIGADNLGSHKHVAVEPDLAREVSGQLIGDF